MTHSARSNLLRIVIPIALFFLGVAVGSWLSSKKISQKSEDRAVYAIYKGQKIFSSDISPQISNDLRQIEKNKYAIKKQAVENFIQSKNPETAIDLNSIQIDESELKAYAKDRGIDPAKLKGQAQTDLRNNFKIYKKMMAQKAQQQQSMQSSDIEWLIPMSYLDPAINVGTGSFPELGSGKGSKKLILYANYHCPDCKEAWSKVQSLKERLKEDLSIHFRFALSENENSISYLTAMGSFCAHDQGKFAEFSQAAFTQQITDVDSMLKHAGIAGINADEFRKCLEARKHKSALEKDFAEADQLGIRATGAMFLNGHPVLIQEPLDEMMAILKQKE